MNVNAIMLMMRTNAKMRQNLPKQPKTAQFGSFGICHVCFWHPPGTTTAQSVIGPGDR